jgi:hypothetical protein
MPRLLGSIVLAVALAAGPRARAQEARPGKGPDVAALRFAWPDRLSAAVAFRRSLSVTGGPERRFSARWTVRAERGEGGTMRIRTTGAEWDGDLPFPEGFAAHALRASERIVEVVDGEGAFLRLEGLEAMRAVLAKLYELAEVSPPNVERAIGIAAAAMQGEAETLWNLEVGFWTGADLEVGETYEMESEGEPPLLPGVRTAQALEFKVRRRVPCTARDRTPRCVEVMLRSTPDPAVLPRIGRALVREAWGRGPGREPEAVEIREVAAEDELLLVTDPATLLPHDVAWTRSVRVSLGGEEPREVERVERTVYAYRYGAAPSQAPGPARVGARAER